MTDRNPGHHRQIDAYFLKNFSVVEPGNKYLSRVPKIPKIKKSMYFGSEDFSKFLIEN